MLDSCRSLMACCNCGVMTRPRPCRISSFCPTPAMVAPCSWLEREPLAEIDAAHVAIADDFGGCAFLQQLAVVQNVGTVDDIECVAHIVIRDQNADAAILQVHNEIANFAD